MNTPTTCKACSFSYMEPDSGLICGHNDAGWAGLTIRKYPLDHCGWKKFEQHPLRNADGTLKQVHPDAEINAEAHQDIDKGNRFNRAHGIPEDHTP